MLPSISVIVPVYNIEQYLPICLDSILAQTFSDFECIVVDDCSNDKCPEICDRYALKDKRIKIIHHKKNKGLPLSRKTGFSISSGKYIIHIDGDDYLEVSMLEKMYSIAVSQDYDMVYCDYYYNDISNNAICKNVPILSDDFAMNIRNSILDFGFGGVVWNKLIKKTIYDCIKFPKYGFNEDKYITAQTLFFSKKIGYAGYYLYHYQFRQNSILNSQQKKLEKFIGALDNFKRVFTFLKKNYGINMSSFEPELTKRINWIKRKKKGLLKEIIKKILLFIFPVTVYNNLKSFYNMLFNKCKTV